MGLTARARAALEPDCDLGVAEAFAGRLSPASLDSYAPEWGPFKRWCQPPLNGQPAPDRWLSYLPASTETLRDYVDFLCQQGRAPATIRRVRAAILAWHRLHGKPVPDGFPASEVLSAYHRSLKASGWSARRAEPLPLDDVLGILRACDQAKNGGLRDAVMIVLAYSAGLRPHRMVAVRLRDVEVPPVEAEAVDGVTISPADPDGDDERPRIVLGHRVLADGTHDPLLCTAEIVGRWWRRLNAAGADPASYLVRAVDKADRIAGVGDRFCGGDQNPGGGINVNGLGYALAKLLIRADVPDPQRYGWESFRLGGLIDARLLGATVRDLSAATGLVPSSGQLLDIVRTAEGDRP